MSKISFAVVALRINEVETVIGHLRAQGMAPLADWLESNKTSLYGTRAEDWKPFDGNTIMQLLNTQDDDDYHSETHLLDALNADFSNIRILVKSKIELYFIDVFALFFEKYIKLASRLDLLLAESTRKCCLIMPYGLSQDSTFMLTAYGQVWGAVTEAYLQGSLHPVVMRAEDVTHLRNYLLTVPISEEEPNPDIARQMDARYPRKGKPQFA